MAGISSKALSFGDPENHKQFNGIEHTTDLDLNQYDAFYRTLDPQIGRFLQIDPKIESAEAWSPYSAMLDNPIRYADPLGDSTIPGAGFWRNAWEGLKDGGRETVNFVKSLGTKEGWENLGNSIADMGDRMNPSSPSGLAKNAEAGLQTYEAVKNIPNMTKDDVGHALGYGTEKVAEAVVLTKGAGAVSKALQGAEATTLTKTAAQLGKEGMTAAGIEQNTTRIPSLTGTAQYRVPDGLTNTTLSEVKNVSKLSLTNQIKDYSLYSKQQGLNFELHVRPTTQLSKPLQQQIRQGNITLKLLNQ